MRLAIIGSRTFKDYDLLCRALKGCVITQIVSGGAKGADSLGAQYAKDNNIPLVVYWPEWDKYGKSAGFKRNEQIIDNCDEVVAFWDGVSRGTAHSIGLAEKQNKPVAIVKF